MEIYSLLHQIHCWMQPQEYSHKRVVSCDFSETRSSKVKSILKSMEIKSFFFKSFVSTLNSISVVCGSGLKNWPTFSSLDMIYSKNPQNFNMDEFSWRNWFDISFWFTRNAVAFESTTKFHFSTSYDLETAKLPSQGPFKKMRTFLCFRL